MWVELPGQVWKQDSTESTVLHFGLEYRILSQNIEENYSLVQFRMAIWRTGSISAYNLYDNTSNYTIDGTVFNFTSRYDFRTLALNTKYYMTITSNNEGNNAYSTGGTTQFPKGSTVVKKVYHDSDGSKRIDVSAQLEGGISSFMIANSFWNIPLDTIPRASSVTATNAAIDSASSININRYSSSFTHKLYYKFAGQSSYTLIASGVATSAGWTVPTSAYALIPNAKTISCEILCETYSGTTYIGSSTTNMTASVDEATNAPTVSAVITDTNPISLALTDLDDKMVKFISNARTVITATAKNSATIASRKVTCGDGKTSSSADSTLNSVESGTFTVEATDSRGIKTTVVYNKTLVNYVKLTLDTDIYRTQPTNNIIAIKFSGNYFNGNFGTVANTLNVKYRYREKGTTTWSSYTNLTKTISSNTYSNGAAEIVLGTTFDYTKSYEFEVVANDQVYTGVEIISQKTVSQGLPNYWWNAGSFNHETDVFVKGDPILVATVVEEW